METVFIQRIYGTEFQMLGILWTVRNGQLFVAKTLELPDKNNASRISCIPAGEYEVSMSYSFNFKKHLYEIRNVPGRSGIRIHSANYHSQLLGCIALGSALKDINSDGRQDIVHSGDTMAEFEKLMESKPFTLIIQNPTYIL